jgi:hypothetical protein
MKPSRGRGLLIAGVVLADDLVGEVEVGFGVEQAAVWW